ncbi:MAG: hypothetical protein Q7W16_01905 [Coriobacteriia bacterium]|nr:hypothetical protein [Coriobacteriia bacterium]
MKLRNAQVIGVALALLVGVLAVAAPWCQTSLCAAMMQRSSTIGDTACATDTGPTLSAKCGGMRTATAEAAVAAPKAPSVPDLLAMTGQGVGLPDVTWARTVSVAPPGDPPRLVLDTSRLRI